MRKTKVWGILTGVCVFSLCLTANSHAWWYKTGTDVKVKELEKRIKIYEELLTVMEYQKRNIEQQRVSLDGRKKVIIRTIDVKENAIEELNKKTAEMEELSHSLKSSHASQVREMENHFAAQIKKVEKDLQSEKQRLADTERDLQAKAKQLQRLDEKYQEMVNKPKECQEQIAKIERENRELQDTNQQLSESNGALSESNDQLRDQIAEKDILIKTFEMENEELASKPGEYEEKLLMAEWERKNLEESYVMLEDLVQEKETALMALNEKIADQREALVDHKIALEAKEEDMEDVVKDLSFYKKQSDKIDFLLAQKNKDISLLRDQVSSLKKELVDKQYLIIEKNKTLSLIQAQLGASEAKVQEMLQQRQQFVSSLRQGLRD